MLASGQADIRYVFETAPERGAVIKVAEGLLWARVPLPFRLDHVNIWLLEEDDGWTAIDSGCDTADVRADWERLLAGPLGGKPLRRHIATHGHTDHIGLSGWLVERFDMPFVATLCEWMGPQVRQHELTGPMRPEVEVHLRELGCEAAVVNRLKGDREWALTLTYPMPAALDRIVDGDEITFGGRRWQVITGGGHAPEHASYYCAADGILIAGDQILPRISPMIGVFSEQPRGNPLGEYLASFEKFARIPDDVLVLPSHGLPFFGLHTRIEQLRDHHQSRLDLLLSQMTGEPHAMRLAEALFPKAIHEGHARLALAETVAHINYLIGTGEATRHRDDQGILRFRRPGAAAVTAKREAAPARPVADSISGPRIARARKS